MSSCASPVDFGDDCFVADAVNMDIMIGKSHSLGNRMLAWLGIVKLNSLISYFELLVINICIFNNSNNTKDFNVKNRNNFARFLVVHGVHGIHAYSQSVLNLYTSIYFSDAIKLAFLERYCCYPISPFDIHGNRSLVKYDLFALATGMTQELYYRNYDGARMRGPK